MKNLNNKVIIITGASSGVGKACAELFAEERAKLVLIARGKEALIKLAEQLNKKTEVLPIAMDVSNPGAGKYIIEQTIAKFGSIDVLVNNAAYHQRGAVEKISLVDLKKMVDVNLKTPIEWIGLIIPHLKKKKGGSIVNVGSLAGRTPLEGAATYAATKAGLRSFTYSLADEMRPYGVHVGLVSPGPIATGFILDDIDAVEDIVFSQPMSSAEDVAAAVRKVALGEKIEICCPKTSGWLTTISYLIPYLRRSLRPWLAKKGRRNKEVFRSGQDS